VELPVTMMLRLVDILIAPIPVLTGLLLVVLPGQECSFPQQMLCMQGVRETAEILRVRSPSSLFQQNVGWGNPDIESEPYELESRAAGMIRRNGHAAIGSTICSRDPE
jgi:hypothetical protein